MLDDWEKMRLSIKSYQVETLEIYRFDVVIAVVVVVVMLDKFV